MLLLCATQVTKSTDLINSNILTFPQFTKLHRCGLWDAILDGNRSRKRIRDNVHQ